MTHFKYELAAIKVAQNLVKERNRLSEIALNALVTNNIDYALSVSEAIVNLDEAIRKIERACGINDRDSSDVCK